MGGPKNHKPTQMLKAKASAFKWLKVVWCFSFFDRQYVMLKTERFRVRWLHHQSQEHWMQANHRVPKWNMMRKYRTLKTFVSTVWSEGKAWAKTALNRTITLIRVWHSIISSISHQPASQKKRLEEHTLYESIRNLSEFSGCKKKTPLVTVSGSTKVEEPPCWSSTEDAAGLHSRLSKSNSRFHSWSVPLKP